MKKRNYFKQPLTDEEIKEEEIYKKQLSFSHARSFNDLSREEQILIKKEKGAKRKK